MALVVVPEFDGTRLSGATRWLNRDLAIVQLSLRHKTDDHVWFTLWHELGHVLQQPRHDFFDGVEGDHPADADVRAEQEADAFARNTLIDLHVYEPFVATQRFTVESVREFAEQQDVSPGIVVGRLQHDGLVSPSKLNHLKRQVDFG